jgi:hypothetical protein
MMLRSGLPRGTQPNRQRPLTQQNLQAHANQTTGHKSHETESSDGTSISSSTVSSTDPMLPRHLYRAGVLFEGWGSSASYPLPPGDKQEVLRYLQRKQKGLNNEQARDFSQRLHQSFNEEVYKSHFVSVILNPSSRRLSGGYSVQMDLPWTAVKDNFTAVKGFTDPKPDYFEAFDDGEYPPKALDALGWSLLPCPLHPITMPTLCIEFKAPDNCGLRNADAQAAHDGAVMVHAQWERHKYMKKPAQDFFGKTKALVMAIAGRQFALFACHATPVGWNQVEDEYPAKLNYHIFPLVNSLIVSEDDVKAVCLTIRNAQDWCRAQAKSAKDELCEYFEGSDCFSEDREANDARRLAANAERTAKRTAEGAELEEHQPARRRRL